MPPQLKEDPTVHPLDFLNEKGEPLTLEDRKLEINLKQTIHNIKNLDYSQVVWRNVFLFVVLHLYSVYGFYLAVTASSWKTLFFSYLLYLSSGIGVTMGTHRLWSHKSFKAVYPLRVVLMLFQTIAFQNHIYEWSRDHRVHHKYSETDADPHNAKRGLFFAHMGWLMCKKHPDVREKGKNVDVSDLLEDPVVVYQKKYYLLLVVLMCFAMPTFVPWYFWSENAVTALFVAGFFRYTLGLHITWMVNSVAHWEGDKPYDVTIYPVQNKFVSSLAFGEGWHNFHHVFPFDYRTSEWGGILNMNLACAAIDFCAKFGWAYDLKTVSKEAIAHRMLRTGDRNDKSRRKYIKKRQ